MPFTYGFRTADITAEAWKAPDIKHFIYYNHFIVHKYKKYIINVEKSTWVQDRPICKNKHFGILFSLIVVIFVDSIFTLHALILSTPLTFCQWLFDCPKPVFSIDYRGNILGISWKRYPQLPVPSGIDR